MLSKLIYRIMTAFILIFIVNVGGAQTNDDRTSPLSGTQSQSSSIWYPSFYKPVYLLPFYYSDRPYNDYYNQNGIHVGNVDVKFQLSLKTPIWPDILGSNATLYAAYTQLSYWQAYDSNSAFFRESNYAPEIFLRLVYKHSDIDAGAIHQSNGRGGSMERSWNRVYGRFTLHNLSKSFSVTVEPWYIIQESSMKRYNSNIGDFLGYGEITLSMNLYCQIISFMTRNNMESGFERGAEMASWSFPLFSKDLYGYIQLFSGYGQSLAEYDHYTNAFGAGIRVLLH